jgi:hypothetical protein
VNILGGDIRVLLIIVFRHAGIRVIILEWILWLFTI